jgi:hypothetical protein
MNEQKLPVRLFQKREIDIRETEGGGGQDPKWVLSGDALREKAYAVSSQVETIIEEFSSTAKTEPRIPTPIGVEISPNAIAKSHRDSLKNFLADESGSDSVLAFYSETQFLISVRTASHLESIQQRLKTANPFARGISAITRISKYRPDVISGEGPGQPIMKAKLVSFRDDTTNALLEATFMDYCHAKDIKIRRCKYAEGLIVFRLADVTLDGLSQLANIEGLFSIEPMPIYHVGLDSLSHSDSTPIKHPKEGVDYPILGILDSGIEPIPHLAPWIEGKSSPYPDDRLDKSHGTFVAGIAVYGDSLLPAADRATSPCRLFDAAVCPKKSIFGGVHEDEMIDNIDEAIEPQSDRIKVWSLSVGTDKQASLQRFSDFGKALDRIQDSHEVLIIKSAGNCKNFASGIDADRISESADSTRALVVGSIAHDVTTHDLAQLNHRSPFSRVGPGPCHIIKPDLVDYGGNAGTTGPTITTTGVSSFGINGALCTSVGTSFSTPRVAAIVADLYQSVDSAYDHCLLKSLTIHGAEYPADLNLPMLQRVKEMGFGQPSPASSVLYNDEHEVSLILQDDIIQKQFIEVLDFPFPQSMIDDEGFYIGKISVTLVARPLLDQRLVREYCQSNIEVSMGTYDAETQRDTSKSTIKNPIGRSGGGNILKPSLFSTRQDNQNNQGLSERVLLQHGNKYHPCKKFVCDLSDMTPTNKESHLKAPKKWYLKLKGLCREHAESRARAMNKELTQPFCLIVTISDPSRSHDVYTSVVSHLNTHGFIHQDIQIRSHVQVSH